MWPGGVILFLRVLYPFTRPISLIVLLALLSPRRLESQNRPSADISGAVTDQTGAAVVAAKVVFTSGSIVVTQFTDDQGEFAFSQVSAEFGWLEVSAHGFQDQIVNWRAATNRIEIVLLPAGAAEQVTVTANRTNVRVIENASSVVILSTQDLAATAALTTDDILHQVAGFSLFRRTDSRTANPTTQGISLRGLGASGASRALVLADGFPLNDPFGGWVYWGRVPRVDIGSIEVEKMRYIGNTARLPKNGRIDTIQGRVVGSPGNFSHDSWQQP